MAGFWFLGLGAGATPIEKRDLRLSPSGGPAVHLKRHQALAGQRGLCTAHPRFMVFGVLVDLPDVVERSPARMFRAVSMAVIMA